MAKSGPIVGDLIAYTIAYLALIIAAGAISQFAMNRFRGLQPNGCSGSQQDDYWPDYIGRFIMLILVICLFLTKSWAPSLRCQQNTMSGGSVNTPPKFKLEI